MRLITNDLPVLLFWASVFFFGFIGGLATMEFQTFPYEVIRQAKNGIEAILELENDDMMTGVREISDDLPPRPVVTTLAAGAGDEALLVTGGFYQDMETCPTYGCAAWIMDRQGKILHSWEIDPHVLVDGVKGFDGQFGPDNIYPIGTALDKDGALILTFHTRNTHPYQGGLAKFDAQGNLIWKKFDYAHHWFDIDDDGNIYAPSARLLPEPDYFPGTAVEVGCQTDVISDEGVKVYDADGQVIRAFWFSDIYQNSDFPGLLYSLRHECDPQHINSVQLVGEDVAEVIPDVTKDDMLVSIREPSVVAILDGVTGNILKIATGRTAAQHGPQFLPDGSVLIFDNQGNPAHDGGTRIQRLDFISRESETIFPREDDEPALPPRSPDGGHIHVSPDGTRMMVSSKHQATSFEVDIETGEVLWSMKKTFDISPYLQARGLQKEGSNAAFNAYGAYYLTADDLAFLPPNVTAQIDMRKCGSKCGRAGQATVPDH